MQTVLSLSLSSTRKNDNSRGFGMLDARLINAAVNRRLVYGLTGERGGGGGGGEKGSAVRNRPRPRERLSLIDWSVKKKTRGALLNRKLFRERLQGINWIGACNVLMKLSIICLININDFLDFTRMRLLDLISLSLSLLDAFVLWVMARRLYDIRAYPIIRAVARRIARLSD